MKVFDIISEAEVATGILDRYGNPITKTVPDNQVGTKTPTTSVKTKVPVTFDPNMPTRDKLTKGQLRKLSKTGKLSIDGKTYTTKQIAKNTALNKARLNTLAKSGGGNVAKGAEADLKQAMKKNAKGGLGKFIKAPPSILKGILKRTPIGLAIGSLIGMLEAQRILEKWGENFYVNGCKKTVHGGIPGGTAESKILVDNMRELQLEMAKAVTVGVAGLFSGLATGAVGFGKIAALVAKVIPPIFPFGMIAKGLTIAASATLTFGVAYMFSRLAKASGIHDKLGLWMAQNWFTSDAMERYADYLATNNNCERTQEDIDNWATPINESTGDIENAIKAEFKALMKDPKFKRAVKRVKDAPNPKS